MNKKSKSKQEKFETQKPSISIHGDVCGIKWDAKAIEAINTTAKALLNITELFKAQKIEMKSLITISENGKVHVNGDLINSQP